MTTKTKKTPRRSYTSADGIPVSKRFEVQTRSGSEWSGYAFEADIESARDRRAEARQTGYTARIFDLVTRTVVS